MIDSFGVFFCADGLVRYNDQKLCFKALIWWNHGMGMMTGIIMINDGYYAPPAICLQIPSSWRRQHLHQFHLINIIQSNIILIFCRARAVLERIWATDFLSVFSGWLTTLVHEPWHHGIMAPWHDGSLSLSMNHHRIMTLHHIRPFSLPRSMKIIWTLFQIN